MASKVASVDVLDVTKLVFPRKNPPPDIKWLATILAYGRSGSSIEILKEKQAKILAPSRSKIRQATYPIASQKESVRSALTSILSKPPRGMIGVVGFLLERRLLRSYEKVFDAVCSALGNEAYCWIMVANGRFPDQRASLDAAKSYGIRSMHFEVGFTQDSFFFRPHAPQDLSAVQAAISTFQPEPKDLAFAQSWFNNRVFGNVASDAFGMQWQELDPATNYETVVFTTSADEYESLGSLWPKPDWINQFEAIEAVLETKSDLGSVAIRMHPNSKFKTVSYALWEVAQVRRLKKLFPWLQVIPPHAHMSSYQLAARARTIVVWDSTIGLEASWLGRNVLYLAPNPFSRFLGVPEAFDLQSLRSWAPAESSPKSAQKHRAETCIAAIRSFSAPRETRDPEAPNTWFRALAYTLLSFRRDPFAFLILIIKSLSARAARIIYKLLL
jgi:hypothetical protein